VVIQQVPANPPPIHINPLAGPLFRNEASALLLNLSLAASAKWVVLLLFAVFADELKGLCARLVGKIAHRGRRPAHTRRRRPASSPESPSPARRAGRSSIRQASPPAAIRLGRPELPSANRGRGEPLAQASSRGWSRAHRRDLDRPIEQTPGRSFAA